MVVWLVGGWLVLVHQPGCITANNDGCRIYDSRRPSVQQSATIYIAAVYKEKSTIF